jgi:F-type H+-transporting ATPase subunit gamma
MSKTKQLNNQIKTIDVIEKVTKILQISATVKAKELSRRQVLALKYKNFFIKNLDLIGLDGLFKVDLDAKNIIIAISSPKSMSGSLNNEVLKNTINTVTKNPTEKFEIYTYTDKSEKILTKKLNDLKNILKIESFGLKKEIQIPQSDLQKYINNIYEMIIAGHVSKVFLVYPYAKSLLSQSVVVDLVFPLNKKTENTDLLTQNPNDESDSVKQTLLKSYINSCVSYSISACLAAVNYSRMIVTDNANKNSQSKKQELKKIFNNTRQTKITSELIDIVSGSNAL